jgi:hypothetical protein
MNESMNTTKTRENRSLEKSGMDFMTDAKDYNNIIGNLK